MPIRSFSKVPEDTREWGRFFRETTVTADVVAPSTVDTAMLVNNAVEDSKFRDSGALSVIGRPVNSTGDPSDIAAAVDTTVLRRSGAVIGFGSITAAYLSDFTEAAQDAVGGALANTATVNLTYNDGSNAISAAVNDDSVSDAKIRNSGALSVIGRSANSTGDPADIAAANDGEVLRRSGVTLGFGTVATAGLADDAVTNAKAANMADSTIKGRASGAGTGDPTDLTAAQVATIVSTAVASALNITSSTYTPTLTNVSNIDSSTASLCQYVRIGSVVIVSGQVQVDATAAASTELGISLPIASNFSANTNCGGAAFSSTVAGLGAPVLADATNDRARMLWVTTDTANRSYFFCFMYQVI